MKEINQIIHLTDSVEKLKSILKNGFYTSYAKERFGSKNVLIPMISFANILFRDIGENEVVDYGSYGIVFDREYIIEKFNLNPVCYVKNKGELESIFENNFQQSIVPQLLDHSKKFHQQIKGQKFSNHIKINPITDEEINLLNSIDINVNDDLIQSIKAIFERYFINTMKQALLVKPYKVENKQSKIKIAYNEREWRKSFFELDFISEIKPTGEKDEEYQKWINTIKPHFTDKYILNFEPSEVKMIYVKDKNEIEEIKKFVNENLKSEIAIFTLKELQENENK